MKNIFNYIIPAVLLTPMFTLAQFDGGGDEIDTFFAGSTFFINDIIIPVLLALSFLMFIFGVAQYFFFSEGGDNADSRKQGRQLMIWGVIAFVVIVSIWGLVTLIANGLGFGGEDLDSRPKTPTL